MRKQLLIVLFAILYFGLPKLWAQADTISGVINDYAHVSNLTTANSLLTLDDVSPFSSDDRVLLIQMRGASIPTSNNNSFGDIQSLASLNGAGSYMFAKVCLVNSSSNQITLQETIDPSFASTAFDSAGIQLIRVPFYTGDVVINGTLTADPWDGQKGGVLVFEANGNVRMNADIDVSGLGFQGGAQTQPSGTCVAFLPYPNESYTIASRNGGGKGEGVAAFIPGMEAGKGPMANGGGGGNNHNAGGAGGANYGAGGQGGERIPGFGFTCVGTNEGRAGNSLAAFGYSGTNERVYLGGGGGAGHDNNSEGQKGGNGGGIVMITADQLEGNSNSILANGEDALDSGSDGGSGGGAGGVVVLEINSFSGNVGLSVKGGNGGDTGISQCQGPGGGGGGGVIWTSVITPVGVSLNGNGGIAGTATAGGCGSSQGALNGSAGVVISGYTRPSASGTNCVLPTFWTGLTARAENTGILLQGTLSGVEPTVYQVLVRRKNAGEWKELDLINLEGSKENQEVAWKDFFPAVGSSRYQMVLIDVNGQEIASPAAEVLWKIEDGFSWEVWGQSTDKLQIWLENPSPAKIHWKLYSIDGKLLWEQWVEEGEFKGKRTFNLPQLPKGAYVLSAMREGKRSYKKILR